MIGTRPETTRAAGPERGEDLPEIRPGCEVGWIFRDGDAHAIERQTDRGCERAARLVRRRDE
ncbi:MAG: hypothetical protein ACLPYY_09785 [Acidimicrobiales bacterium]